MSSPALDLRQCLRQAAFTGVPDCFAAHEECISPAVNCARHKAVALQAELEQLAACEETVLGQLESAQEAALAAGHDADALGPLFVDRTSSARAIAAVRRAALQREAVEADIALEGALTAFTSLLEAAESLDDDDALASRVEALLEIDRVSRAAVAAIPAAPTTSSYLALALPSADPEALRLYIPEAVFGTLLFAPILADHVHTPHCGLLCTERFAPHVHSAACNHMQGPVGAVFAAAASGDILSLDAALRSGGSTEEVGMINMVGKATAIAGASARGSLEAVQMLLAAGADPTNISLPRGCVFGALHAAALAGHDVIVGCLLADLRVDPNALAAQDGVFASPLSAALVKRHVAVVQVLLSDPRTDLGAISGIEGMSALHIAAAEGLDVMVRLLLADSRGRLNVNARAAHGFTALHMAVNQGHVEVIIALLGDARTDVEAAGNNGATALHIAADKGLDSIVRLLLGDPHGRLNVNARTANGCCTALHAAAHCDHVAVVSVLFADHRTDVSAVADHGVSVLHIAAQAGAEAVTRLLLDSPRLSDVNGRAGLMCDAPWHVAVESGSLGVVRALLQDPRVDTNARREGGLTPLHVAAMKADCASVRLLLDDARVDVNAHDTVPGREWAPVFWARMDRQLVSLFLGHPRVLLTSAERQKIEAALPLEGEQEPQGSWRCLIQ